MTNSGSATVKVTLPTPANQKPAATTAAVYPTNNATDVSTELRFVWKEAVDPDGDKLTYILEYSTDQDRRGKPRNQIYGICRRFKNTHTRDQILLESDFLGHVRRKIGSQ